MDLITLVYAIVITIGIIGGITGFVYLLTKYEGAVLVALGILIFAFAVFVVYLLLEAR